MEVEDEVVEEVDVYLNKNIAQNLHIFQYRSHISPIADRTDIEVKARPNHRVFELKTKIDTKSNFDDKKSELFGYYLDVNDSKTDPKRQKERPNQRLDKQVLKSLEVKPTLGQYCLAVIRNDCPELHLNPIQSVIQFKPKLNYLDNKCPEVSQTVKTKSSFKTDESDADLSSQDETEPQVNIQAITMRFAGPDEERQRKARERSFAYFQQQMAKDDWIPIKYHSIDSPLSLDNRMSLIYNSLETNYNNNSNAENHSISSLQEFLAKIKCSEDTTSSQSSSLTISSQNSSSTCSSQSSSQSSGKLSLSQIRALPLAEQIRHLLINSKLLSFDQIMELLSGDLEPNSVIRSVQNHGLLVRGNWVVKSETLYDKEKCPKTSRTGIPIDLLCRARDYIIWRFTNCRSLSKKEIFTSGRNPIPDEDVVDILKQIAVFDTSVKMWNFLLPDDNKFIDKYPEAVQRQQLLWTTKYQSIERAYSSTNTVVKSESDITSIKPNQRKRRNSRKGSINSIASGGEDNNELIETIGSDLNTNSENVFNPTKLKKERKSPVKSTSVRRQSTAKPVTKERRRSKSPKYAEYPVQFTGTPYPTSEENKDLVKYVTEKLKNNFCVTSEELRKSVAENTSNKLWFNVSEEVIESAVRESGGFKVDNKWPNNPTNPTKPMPLYAMTKFGDQLDEFRETLIEMFSDQTRVRVSGFCEKVRDRQLVGGGQLNAENTCTKLLKDYCVLKSSLYYLKGTVSPN